MLSSLKVLTIILWIIYKVSTEDDNDTNWTLPVKLVQSASENHWWKDNIDSGTGLVFSGNKP